jgi:hypothetical protein
MHPSLMLTSSSIAGYKGQYNTYFNHVHYNTEQQICVLCTHTPKTQLFCRWAVAGLLLARRLSTKMSYDNLSMVYTRPYSHRNRKKSASDKSGEHSGCSKAIKLSLARYLWPTTINIQGHCYAKETNCFVPIFPDVSFSQHLWEDNFDVHFFVHSTPFWNKLIVGVWEPPTKQIYSKCQSSSDLPSSQSARSIITPISTGPRVANWQYIRDGHLERQAFSGFKSITHTKSK